MNRRHFLFATAALCSPGVLRAQATHPTTSPIPGESGDLAMETPVVNTAPGPEFSADVLDYAMVIGMDRTPRGRIWACWVAGGDSEKGLFVAATSDDDGKTWSHPRLVIDPVDSPTGLARRTLVGNFWTDPTGRLWLLFDQSMGYFDGRAGAWAITCDDPDADRPTWSAPRRIWHGCTLQKPTVLSTGDWLMPISLWRRGYIKPPQLKDAHRDLDDQRMAHVFASTDQGKTWARRGGVRFEPFNFDEHIVVERKTGQLWMLARTNIGIAETTSGDAGRTWAEPKPTTLGHINARCFLRRLASGKLLLVKHGRIGERTPKRSHLTAFVSDDDGATWQGGLMLDERAEVSYPDGFQSPDGTIAILYDRDRAAQREILMARFTEQDVLGGRFASPAAAERMIVHKARGRAKKNA